MITLNSIRHTYPGENVAALRDISLTLGDATVTALVGPNGSGKTTLMQILGGLMVPTSGSISIDGSQASADDHSHISKGNREILFRHGGPSDRKHAPRDDLVPRQALV